MMGLKRNLVEETVKDHRADELSAMYNMMMDQKKKNKGNGLYSVVGLLLLLLLLLSVRPVRISQFLQLIIRVVFCLNCVSRRMVDIAYALFWICLRMCKYTHTHAHTILADINRRK